MITVDAALEQGRDVYAVPGRVTDALSGGCNRLIRQGADLILSAQELIGELGGCRNTIASCPENEKHEVNGWNNDKNKKDRAKIIKFDRSAGAMPPGLMKVSESYGQCLTMIRCQSRRSGRKFHQR